jgi:hypothetical protein
LTPMVPFLYHHCRQWITIWTNGANCNNRTIGRHWHQWRKW